MASASLTPYYNNSLQETFSLVSAGTDKTTWKVTGRDLALPKTLTIERKIGAPGKTANDHILIRISQSERNATTGLIATASATLDLSIARDTSVLNATAVRYLPRMIASLLNDSAACSATSNNASAIVAGLDV